MAVPKSTRKSALDKSQLIEELFRASSLEPERQQDWKRAQGYAGTDPPVMRFPLYERLSVLNVHARKMIDVVKEVSGTYALGEHRSLYIQMLIEQARNYVSHTIVDFMNGVEITDGWVSEQLRVREERKLHDPDDVYFEVRKREAERVQHGLPARIRFLDEEGIEKAPGPPARRRSK